MKSSFVKIPNRYAYLDDGSKDAVLEINLQKVRIARYHDSTGHSKYEVVQFSRRDTIRSFLSHLIDLEKHDENELWMVTNLNDSFPVFINGIKEYDRQDNQFKSNWKKVEPNDDNVMSLGLNKRSLLILIEDEKTNECNTNPTDIQENDQANFLIPDDERARI